MSQALVLELLQELGGRARLCEIMNLAKKKYPDRSLWQYCGLRLVQLQKWHLVRKIGPRVGGQWILESVK